MEARTTLKRLLLTLGTGAALAVAPWTWMALGCAFQ